MTIPDLTNFQLNTVMKKRTEEIYNTAKNRDKFNERELALRLDNNLIDNPTGAIHDVSADTIIWAFFLKYHK